MAGPARLARPVGTEPLEPEPLEPPELLERPDRSDCSKSFLQPHGRRIGLRVWLWLERAYRGDGQAMRPGREFSEGQVDGRGARNDADKGDLVHSGEWKPSAECGGGLDGHMHLTICQRDVQRRLLLAVLATNRADFFPKTSEISNSSVFAGMEKGGRYGYRRPPELDCISAQIQQVKILCVKSAVEPISWDRLHT